MSTRVPSSPGPAYDGKWMYWFWDWVRGNRAGFVGSGVVFTSHVLGTLAAGTTPLTLSTTGVSTGSYGNPTVIPRFDVNAQGRITNATNAGTLGTFGGFNSLVGAGDLLGTTTTSTLTGALSTTGVVAGTYGSNNLSAKITVDAKGRLTAVSEVAITGGTGTGVTAADISLTSPLIFSVGTGTGAVLQPFTVAHATSSVAAGTYGAPAGIPRFDINAHGHVISGTTVGTVASLVVGTGDPSAVTALTVLGAARLRRNDTSAEGGQLNFDRALDGSAVWFIDVIGTSTTASIRVVNVPGPTGTLATVPLLISQQDRWNGAGGGFGLGTGNAGFTYDGTGFMIIRSPDGVNGPNLQFIGTGATPNKSLRVGNNGQFQILNNAYSAAIFQLNDSGNLTSLQHITVATNGTFGGNLRVLGARIDANYAALIAGTADSIALDLRNRAADDFAALRFLNNAATIQQAFIRSGSSSVLDFVCGTSFTEQFRVHTGGGTFSGTLAGPYAALGTVAGTYGTFGNLGVGGTSAATRFSGDGVVPTGCILPYGGTAAPSAFLMCYGQPVDRGTYADLFGVISTVYGTGDGATTFNVPDLRGRAPFGKDNMGGTAASRVTSTSGISAGTLGAVGGSEQLHAHNHTASDSGHTHSASDSGHAHSQSGATMLNAIGSAIGANSGITNSLGGTTASASANISVASGSANITVGTSGGGSSQNMPPTIVLNYIIKT